MKILCIGDVVGRPGRDALHRALPGLVQGRGIDLVIANGENAAGGAGITPETAKDMHKAGVDVITTGNHVWKFREIVPYLDADERILRPLNFPEGSPGRGVLVREDIAVVNLIGRVFMEPVDNPFAAVDEALRKLEARVIIVDMHCEATSEKRAMGHFLDGRVSVVFGTHTHVPTADEEVLSAGTAYVTDVGMTGPYDSVIGVVKENILERFTTNRPVAYAVAERDVRLCALEVDIDDATGRARGVERLTLRVNPVS